MKTLFLGTTIFCAAFFLHLLIWKISMPKRQRKMLLEIFLGTLIVSFVILRGIVQLTILEYVHIALFFIALTTAYIITYSAIEVDSPSLVMVMHIAQAGPAGLDKEKFGQLMNDDVLIKPRLEDLLTDKMIYLDSGRYKLTKTGFLFVRPFILYRKLLRLEKGG